jgi:hypothetical protein
VFIPFVLWQTHVTKLPDDRREFPVEQLYIQVILKESTTHEIARRNSDTLDIEICFESDVGSGCYAEVIFKVLKKDTNAGREKLANYQRDLLLLEELEQDYDQRKQETLETMTSSILAINTARAEILNEMDEGRRTRYKELESIVIHLWASAPSRAEIPTFVGSFLEWFCKFQAFESGSGERPRLLQAEDVRVKLDLVTQWNNFKDSIP